MIRALALSLTLIAIGCKSTGKKETSTSVPFQVRAHQSQTLPNGLTILWIADQSLPYVSLQMMVKSGSAADPHGKEGAAAITGSLLERGAGKRTATQIAEDLEQIGSGFDVEVQPDYLVASSSTLSFNRDNLLGQFRELLLEPTFPKDELDRQRDDTLAGIQKLGDQPAALVEYLAPRFVYGSQPYGHGAAGTPASLRALKREDLVAYYQANFTPANSVLAVVGQFDDAWKQKVADTFAKWPAKATPKVTLPDFPQWKGVESLLVDRADLNQAQLEILFKGIQRDVPDYMEVRAALKILGEGFGSRLFYEIRQKRGLTYGVYSLFDPREKAGPMWIYTYTRVDKFAETLKETLATYRKFVADGVTDEEVVTVKALMRGQFPRLFETPEGLARQLLILRRYGIDPSYLTNYFATVDRMTKDSINTTIKRHFTPDALKILVHAPAKATEAELKALGPVEIKDYRTYLK